MVYGASGYTGQLIARVAREVELGPEVELVMAGRSAAKVEPIARAHGYEARVFDLDSPSTVDDCLDGVGAVLHCAGPFSRTSRPMVEACVRQRVHYLDITGEVRVFEDVLAYDAEARARGVMLMPGVGFDVVPSDCLAVHVARRVPRPTRLRIAILPVGGRLSHGTATTALENIHKGSFVRAGGALVPVPVGKLRAKVDFGRGPRLVVGVPLGDVVTAWRSTGISDIETYLATSAPAALGIRALSLAPWLVGSAPVQRLVQRRVDRAPAGPTDEERAAGRSIVWAEVRNAEGAVAVSRLETPEGYTTTAHAALAIARRVAAGEVRPGFQTPGLAYGADLVLEVPGSHRVDVS